MKPLQTWNIFELERIGRAFASIWIANAFMCVLGDFVLAVIDLSKDIYYPIALILFIGSSIGMVVIGNEEYRRDMQHPWTAKRHQ